MSKYAFVSLMLLSFTPISLGKITGELELLRAATDAFEANYQKLNTWRGTARITSSVLRGKGEDVVNQQGVYQASFVADRTFEAVRWEWVPHQETESHHGQKSIQTSFRTGGMSKGDYDYLVYYYDYGKPHEERSLHFHGRGSYPLHFQSAAFNPIRILDSFAPPSIAKRLRSYYDHAGSPDFPPGTVTRENHQVTLTLSQEIGGNVCTEQHVFDLSQGGSLVEHYNDSPGLSKTHWQVNYAEVSGVFVPRRISLTSENIQHVISSKRTAVITTDWVNHALSEEDFSLSRLGIKPGDSVRNAVNNERYSFGEDIVEADIVPLTIKDLRNQPLPSFDGIDIELDADSVEDHRVLLCFMDIYQRPSRHCIENLSRQSERLKATGLQLLAIQASPVDESDLAQWMKDNEIDMTTGRVTGHVRKVRAAWGVRGLPWLILTDKEHVVTAEGFALQELNDRVKTN